MLLSGVLSKPPNNELVSDRVSSNLERLGEGIESVTLLFYRNASYKNIFTIIYPNTILIALKNVHKNLLSHYILFCFPGNTINRLLPKCNDRNKN